MPLTPSGQSRPKISDVAAAAGVSRALVSLVMRDAPGASDATRLRVRAVAESLGYRPDPRARILRQRHSNLIGVAFDGHQPLQRDLLDHLYPLAAGAGFEIVLSPGPLETTTGANESTGNLVDARCEALFLLGSPLTDEMLMQLDTHIPTIAIGIPTLAIDAIVTDDAGGSALAVHHLADLGHRDIAHVDGGSAPGADGRRSGYLAAMIARGLATHIRILAGGATEADGAAAALRLVSALPTAVVAFNDLSAIGVLGALRRIGIVVPGDVSVVGFDNSSSAALPHVDLSSIAQNIELLAGIAMERVRERLSEPVSTQEHGGQRHPPLQKIVPGQLVVRGTSARPRRH